jgi:hypothetical protein
MKKKRNVQEKSTVKKTMHCGTLGTRTEFIDTAYYPEVSRKNSGRSRRYRESSPKQKTLNGKRARRQFERLVKTNFSQKDLCVHLTYEKEISLEEADHQTGLYLRRINDKRKRLGLPPAKYIVITEQCKSGRIHHHIIMDGLLDRDIVESKWGLGYANADRLQPDRRTGLAALVAYLSKDPQGRKRWKPSKNLEKPWVSEKQNPLSKKKINLLKNLPEDSEVVKKIIEDDNPGYRLIEFERTYSQETGQWYLYAKMILSTIYEQKFVNKVIGGGTS